MDNNNSNINNEPLLPTATAGSGQPQSQPWYKNGSLLLGSCIGGIPIYLHFTYFLYFFAEISAAIKKQQQPKSSLPDYYVALAVLLSGPILLLTILVHEFGHALTAKALGVRVGDIVLWPLGGFVQVGSAETIESDFLVAVAGPLTHIPQMLFWHAMFEHVTTTSQFWRVLTLASCHLNAGLMAFNLFVPAYPLDGGRCLASALIYFGMDIVEAGTVTAMLGLTIGAVIGFAGMAGFILGRSLLGLPGGLVTVVIGGWIYWSSFKLFQVARGPNAEGNLSSHPIFGRGCYQNR